MSNIKSIFELSGRIRDAVKDNKGDTTSSLYVVRTDDNGFIKGCSFRIDEGSIDISTTEEITKKKPLKLQKLVTDDLMKLYQKHFKMFKS